MLRHNAIDAANDEEIRLEAIFATVALRTQRRCSIDNRGRIGRHHLLRAFKPCWLRDSMRSSTDDWAIIIGAGVHPGLSSPGRGGGQAPAFGSIVQFLFTSIT